MAEEEVAHLGTEMVAVVVAEIQETIHSTPREIITATATVVVVVVGVGAMVAEEVNASNRLLHIIDRHRTTINKLRRPIKVTEEVMVATGTTSLHVPLHRLLTGMTKAAAADMEEEVMVVLRLHQHQATALAVGTGEDIKIEVDTKAKAEEVAHHHQVTEPQIINTEDADEVGETASTVDIVIILGFSLVYCTKIMLISIWESTWHCSL